MDFDSPHFDELRFNFPFLTYNIILEGCRDASNGFAIMEESISLLKQVQIQDRVGVSLGSFIRQAVSFGTLR